MMLDAFGRLSRNWTAYSIIKEKYFVNQQNHREFSCSLTVQLLFLHSIIYIAIYSGMTETWKGGEKSLFRFHCAHSQMHQKCNSATFFRGWVLFRIGTIRVRLNQFALVAQKTHFLEAAGGSFVGPARLMHPKLCLEWMAYPCKHYNRNRMKC